MLGRREGNHSKISQVWHDLLPEVQSWARWISFYLLPSWLSFPFQFSFFKTLYFLGVLALALVYIPLGPLSRFFQDTLVDLWGSLVGENSARSLAALLESFPGEWVLLSLIALTLWGVVVLFWAWKRHLFFKAVKHAGIRIVRGPGRRTAFLNRLQKRGVSGLGLGPTARLLPVYVPRKEDTLLIERIRSNMRERLNLGVFIIGIATSGKTRTAMEVIADLKPALVFVWPREFNSSTELGLRTWSGSAILFSDNVTLAARGGDVPLPAAMLQFLQQCPHLIMVGTIRRNLVPEDLRQIERIELSEIPQSSLLGLARYVASAESKTGEETTSGEDVMQRYNGHPAGIVAGVDAMRQIYGELQIEQKAPLKAAKQLRALGIRNLTVQRVREAAELIYKKQYSDVGFHDLLDELSETGLINWAGNKSREDSIDVYEGYLDQVIDLPDETARLEKGIVTCWMEREDAEALLDRADSLTTEDTQFYQNNPQGALLAGISFYQEALRSYTEERAPLDYAATQNNLGNTYRNLAGYREPVENLERAIQAYTQALRSYTEERAPLQYATTQNNLGAAYSKLAGYREPVENLERAIQAYTQALRFRTEERAPLDYAMTQNNLGTAYSDLAGYREPVENLERAIQAYTQALRSYTEERAPLQYATTQNNLGEAYSKLGESLKAIAAYENAGAVYRRVNQRRWEATILIKIGGLYAELDMREQALTCASDLQSIATELQGEALDLWNDLGNLFSTLEEHEQAVAAYSEAIKVEPKQAMLYRNRAVEFIYLENWTAAESDLSEAASLDPHHPYLEGRRGDLAFWQKQFDRAAIHYELAMQNSEDPSWVFGLAMAYVGLGNLEKANEAFELAFSKINGDKKKEWLADLRRARAILEESELLDGVEKKLSESG